MTDKHITEKDLQDLITGLLYRVQCKSVEEIMAFDKQKMQLALKESKYLIDFMNKWELLKFKDQ